MTSRNFDGDRERECLSDLTADVTSTWWTCVGDGSVSVPPLFEYGMIWIGTRKRSPMMTFNDLG